MDEQRKDTAEKRRRWNKLKAEHGPKLEERVNAIRKGPWEISRAEARNSALAELGYDSVETAIALDIDEHTVTNHRADIRRKTNMPKEACAFDMIFLLLLPLTEK